MIWHREPDGRGVRLIHWVPAVGDYVEMNLPGQQVEVIVLELLEGQRAKVLPIWNCEFNTIARWEVRIVSLRVLAYLPTPEAIADECSRFDKLPRDNESGLIQRMEPRTAGIRPIPKEWLRIAKRLAGIRDD